VKSNCTTTNGEKKKPKELKVDPKREKSSLGEIKTGAEQVKKNEKKTDAGEVCKVRAPNKGEEKKTKGARGKGGESHHNRNEQRKGDVKKTRHQRGPVKGSKSTGPGLQPENPQTSNRTRKGCLGDSN